MRILDSTASNRSMWYQKDNPYTVFMDQRYEKANFAGEIINVSPNVIARWQNLPFKNDSFDMVIFDPPHIFRNEGAKPGGMSKKYGVFYRNNWREIVRIGATELFRVLKQHGTFILKWSEIDMNIEEIYNLLPYKPMFGTRTGLNNNTIWVCFIKYNPNSKLSDFFVSE